MGVLRGKPPVAIRTAHARVKRVTKPAPPGRLILVAVDQFLPEGEPVVAARLAS